jgi:hypothetical protein
MTAPWARVTQALRANTQPIAPVRRTGDQPLTSEKNMLASDD